MPLSGVDAVALTRSFIWFGASIIHVRILAPSASSAAIENREPENKRPGYYNLKVSPLGCKDPRPNHEGST